MLRRCSFATLVLNCETACVLFTSSQFCGQCIVERVVPRETAATHMTQRIHRLQTESQRYPVAQPISREPPATLVHTKWESTWPLEMGNSCPNLVERINVFQTKSPQRWYETNPWKHRKIPMVSPPARAIDRVASPPWRLPGKTSKSLWKDAKMRFHWGYHWRS